MLAICAFEQCTSQSGWMSLPYAFLAGAWRDHCNIPRPAFPLLICEQVGVFEMKEEGLVAVPNPSASFLGDRTLSANASSAVTVMIEGTRPLLLEVQALCSPVHQVMRCHSVPRVMRVMSMSESRRS